MFGKQILVKVMAGMLLVSGGENVAVRAASTEGVFSPAINQGIPQGNLAPEVFFGKGEKPQLKFSDNKWIIGNGRIQRTVVFKEGGFVTTSLKDLELGKEWLESPAGEGVFKIADNLGEKKQERTIDLSKDFKYGGLAYTWQENLKIKGQGVWTLSIPAMGTGSNAGFNVVIHYDVYPNYEPWLTKWYSIENKTGKKLSLKSIEYERFPLVNGKRMKCFRFDNSAVAIAHDPEEKNGLNIAQANYGYNTGIVRPDGHLISRLDTCGVDLDQWLERTGGVTTKSILEVYKGEAAGAFTHQLFIIYRWASGNCRTVPPWYSAWTHKYSTYRINEQGMKNIKDLGMAGFFIVTLYRGPCDPVTGKPEKIEERYKDDEKAALHLLCEKAGLQFGIHLLGATTYRLSNPSHVALAKKFLGDQVSKYPSLGYIWYEDCSGYVDQDHPGEGRWVGGNWREGWRELYTELKKLRPVMVIHRSWTKECEYMDTCDATLSFDYGYNNPTNPVVWESAVPKMFIKENFGWRKYYAAQPVWPMMLQTADVGLLDEDPETSLAVAAMSGAFQMGQINEFKGETYARAKKWISFNWENRELLQFTQELAGTVDGKPFSTYYNREPKGPYFLEFLRPTPYTDNTSIAGLMHLGPLFKGKYGFILLFNTDTNASHTVTLTINPKDYFLKLNSQNMSVTGMHSGKKYMCGESDGILTLGETIAEKSIDNRTTNKGIKIGPLDWEILVLEKGP